MREQFIVNSKAHILRREEEDKIDASQTYLSMLALTYLYSSANSLSPSFAPTGAHLSPDGLLSLLSSEFSTSSLSQSAARECRRSLSIASLSLSHVASPISCSANNNTQAYRSDVSRGRRYSRHIVYVP